MKNDDDDFAGRLKKLSGRYNKLMKNGYGPLSETELELVINLEKAVTSYEKLLK